MIRHVAAVANAGKEVYRMSKGRIVHECAPDALRHDESIKARWLGV